MTFFESIKVCFSKYADFNGRAGRPEFWWFFLFEILAGYAAATINETVGVLFSLGVLLPSLAVGTRRLHDTHRSGWWQLLIFIPLIGLIVLIIFWAQEGLATDNRYGTRLDKSVPSSA